MTAAKSFKKVEHCLGIRHSFGSKTEFFQLARSRWESPPDHRGMQCMGRQSMPRRQQAGRAASSSSCPTLRFQNRISIPKLDLDSRLHISLMPWILMLD